MSAGECWCSSVRRSIGQHLDRPCGGLTSKWHGWLQPPVPDAGTLNNFAGCLPDPSPRKFIVAVAWSITRITALRRCYLCSCCHIFTPHKLLTGGSPIL